MRSLCLLSGMFSLSLNNCRADFYLSSGFSHILETLAIKKKKKEWVEVTLVVLVWHYIYYNVYITSIKLSISPQSLVVTIWKQFRWAVLALIKMDIARGRVPISDATITTISCPIFSLSGAGTSVVLSFKITVKLKILNLASGASQIDTEKEL